LLVVEVVVVSGGGSGGVVKYLKVSIVYAQDKHCNC